MFHSALVLIRESVGVFSICTASVIWRIIASLRNVPVTFIPKLWITPACFARQCFHSPEFVDFDLSSDICSLPLLYALNDDSPLYTPSHPSCWHSMAYVISSFSQFPTPVVVHTAQSIRSQFLLRNGFDRCNLLFSVAPVLSTTRIRIPLFFTTFLYIFFSVDPGVDGTNNTESNPPSRYHELFCSSYVHLVSTLSVCLLDVYRHLLSVLWFRMHV